MDPQLPQPRKDERSLGDLLKELSAETAELVRKQVELATSEMSEKASDAGAAVASVGVGGAVAFAGALALLYALITALTALLAQFVALGVAVWLAPLVVGVALAAVGYSMVGKSLRRLRAVGLKPEKTTQTLQENTQWLKAKVRS